MSDQSWLNQLDGYNSDEGLTRPATAPASGSSDRVPNPILASTILRDPAGWSDGFHPLATQQQEEDVKEPILPPWQGPKSPEGGEITTTAGTQTTGRKAGNGKGKAGGKGPSPDAGKAQSNTFRATVLEPLIQQCTWDKDQKKWITPATKELLDEWDWAAMAKLDDEKAGKLTSARPMFYTDEPDANQRDEYKQYKPRLDILLSMSDGTWVRYHPSAKLIWNHEGTTSAMRARANLALKLSKKESTREHW